MRMGPLVQRFPEDRIIHMRIGRGLCLLLVWIHHVMGLSVTVQGQINSRESVNIGDGMPGVIIDYQPPPSQNLAQQAASLPAESFNVHQSYITLLEREDPTENSRFHFEPELNDDSLQATFKAAAYGYGQRVLARQLPTRAGQNDVTRIFSQIACSLAIRLQEQAFVEGNTAVTPTRSGGQGEPANLAHRSQPTYYGQGRRRVIEATKLLWADDGLDVNAVERRIASDNLRPFELYDECPPEIKTQSEDWYQGIESGDLKALWHRLYWTARLLSIVILAFANIINLDHANDLPICEEIDHLALTDLAADISDWDGKGHIPWNFDTWFTIIVILMRSSTDGLDLDGTALVSESGWSVMYTTLQDDVDPARIGTYGQNSSLDDDACETPTIS